MIVFFNKLLACQLAIIDRDIAAMNKNKNKNSTEPPRSYGVEKKKIFRVIFIKPIFSCYSFYDYFFVFLSEWRKKRNVTAASSSPRNIPMFFNIKNVSLSYIIIYDDDGHFSISCCCCCCIFMWGSTLPHWPHGTL